MSEETKKPHPLSKEGRALREQEKSVNSEDLQEKLEVVKQTTNAALGEPPEFNIKAIEEKVAQNEQQQTPPEPSIPASVVEKMIADAIAKAIPAQQPIQQQVPTTIIQQMVKQEYDIDDIPECRDWEVKDRIYEYIDGKPITASIPVQHRAEIPLQYTNKDNKSVHILRYATNQPSFFVEKQSKEPGSVVLAEILFSYGKLFVPKENINLQKFLHIHQYKNIIFREFDPTAKSKKAIADKRLKHDAEKLAWEVGDITNRAIAGLEFADYVETWEDDILMERILSYIENNAQKFIDYTGDPGIKMKGVIKSALAAGDLIYSNYRWLNKSREVILDVSKNQDEMDEMVRYFEGGVGRTYYEFLLNK